MKFEYSVPQYNEKELCCDENENQTMYKMKYPQKT